jgi:hypothetical protein
VCKTHAEIGSPRPPGGGAAAAEEDAEEEAEEQAQARRAHLRANFDPRPAFYVTFYCIFFLIMEMYGNGVLTLGWSRPPW